MKLRGLFHLLYAGSVLFLLAGCQEVRIENGKYETTLEGRRDFVAVYGDMIFVRVRNPQEQGVSGGYWEWAGKYSIDSATDRIYLDMDKQSAKLWDFYYEFYRQRNSICVVDLSRESSYDLHFDPAQSDEIKRRLKRRRETEEDLDRPANDSTMYR